MKDILYIWLQENARIIGAKAAELSDRLGGIEELYRADEKALLRTGLVNQRDCEALRDKSLQKAEKIYNECREKGISIMNMSDPIYPDCLRKIEDAPNVLYYKGTVRDFDNNIAIGVVGQRKATAIGKMKAEQIGYELAKNGAFVISGLAAGIDGASHRGAIKANGYTVGVLGTGIDVFYPVENAGLTRTMFKQGLVISEFPPGTKGMPVNFPRRNRIVSGLSRAVVVVEAQVKSGSLITARLAREQDKDVFAMIGESSGCCNLLAKGLAVPVQTGKDILSYYIGSAQKEHAMPKKELSDTDRDIMHFIALGKRADEILSLMGIEISALTRRLNMLEIKGYIIKTGHMKYEISE